MSLFDRSQKSFDVEKFKQFLHYIIHKTDNIPNVGKTVLYKIMYFTDFNYYEMFEEKITGETYLKLQYGPAPRDFDTVIDELKDNGLVKEKKWVDGAYPRMKYFSKVEPKTTKIAKKELNFIDGSIDKYSHLTATKISEHSHNDIPYIVAEDFEELDYELVFYRDTELSVRTYEDE